MGVITQAVMRVRKIPAKQEFHGILFPSFEHGVAAIHTMVRKESHPAMVRYVAIPPPRASRVVRVSCVVPTKARGQVVRSG